MNINSNYDVKKVYSLYNTMFQGNLAVHNNKLNRGLFSNNKARNSQTLGTSEIGYINNIKSSSKALSGTLKELSGSAFSKKTMASSNTDLMSVDYAGKRAGSIKPMDVKVDQIAAGQMNEGKRMNSADKYAGNKGTNKFAIDTGGKTTQLSINVAAGDTNKDVQQKMADAINKAGIGIKATVQTDSETNASILKLESTTTGSDSKNRFTVRDTSGDLTERTGANNVERESQDAIYSINGGSARTSRSNTVNLGNGVSATFKQAFAETVSISQSKDTNYAMGAVSDLVNKYNDLYAEAVQRNNDPKSQNLASKMISTSMTYSNSLSGIGIGFDNSGRMTLDTQKLNQASESGKLEQFFIENSGRNYGFANQLGKLADNVSRNTSNFVSSSLFGNSMGENFAYSSFGDLIQYNYLGAGSILDFML